MHRRRFVRRLIAAFASAAGVVHAGIATPLQSGGADAAAETPPTTRRERELSGKLRCLVCQNQTIADSNADLAQDLRRQVRAQIGAGRSDEQILQFMVQRYGEFVLYEPPLKPSTLLLWLGPALLLGGGGWVAVREIRQRMRASLVLPLADEDRARAQALLRSDAGPATDPR